VQAVTDMQHELTACHTYCIKIICAATRDFCNGYSIKGRGMLSNLKEKKLTKHKKSTIFCGILFLLVFICCSGVYIWPYVGKLQSTIPQSLIPTAEYLFYEPQPKQLLFYSVTPEGGTITFIQDIDTTLICVSLVDHEESEIGFITTTVSFVINGKKLPLHDVNIDYGTYLIGVDGPVFSACTDPKLTPGLHIVEARVREGMLSQFDIGTLSTYKWAFRVEEQQNTE
jgi:hypothetical protein